MLADYQDRGRVSLDAGEPPGGMLGSPTEIGDGWLRLLRFDTASNPPTIQMQTFSTHYDAYSSELPEYASWYRAHEQPKMTDDEFLAAEEYEIVLDDFRARFGAPTAQGPQTSDVRYEMRGGHAHDPGRDFAERDN